MKQPANQLVEHFFRHESAHLVAVLTRAFGIRRIDLVEDMVQVAMLEAMHAWKQRGVPENPAAWIHRAARHRMLDALRREKTYENALAFSGHSMDAQESIVDQWLEVEHLPDSLLRMIFVCCHPSLDRKTQIALTLKTLCGFGISEIARGLLLPGETVKKRIQRAKNSLATANVRLELPGSDQLTRRLDVGAAQSWLTRSKGDRPTTFHFEAAIAIGQAGDPREAMSQLQSLRGRDDMKDYLLLDCAFARIHELEGNTKKAIDSYSVALSKTVASHEKELLERKLHKLAGGRSVRAV